MQLVSSFVVLGGLGVIFGALLAVAAQRFAVEEDPRVETICDLLPGANCGACGFPGCVSFAEKVVSGEAPIDACIPGGKTVCDSVCEVIGAEASGDDVKKVVQVFCLGTKGVAHDKFEYHGVPDCKAAAMFSGGFKACEYGCLGLGTCVEVCPFDAMHMGADGLPKVDVEKCTGCCVCAKACPREILRIVNAEAGGKYVPCNSKDRGKKTRQSCEVGCIGCKACVKACEQEAIVVENNLAFIDPVKCNDCGECVEACKRDIIKDLIKVEVAAK